MKKILALLLALSMVFVFTACGEQAADTQTGDEGITELVLAEGIPAFTFPDPIYECSIPDGTDVSCTHCYSRDPEGTDISCKVFEYDKEDMTLEEATELDASNFFAGWTITEFQGTECGYYCTSYERDGKWILDRSWIFETEDKFIEFSKYTDTVELEIADSGVFLWVPKYYVETEANNDNEDTLSSYIDEIPDNTNLPVFPTFDINYNTWFNDPYADTKEYLESLGFENIFSEDQWKAWQADGWTLDEIKEYYDASYEVANECILDKEKYGTEALFIETITKNSEGVEMRTSRVIIPYKDAVITVRFEVPEAEWTEIGAAFANSIHVK